LKILECIIADDERLARDVLENYISRTEGLQLVAMCRNAYEVDTFLQKRTADILFLDIEMPERTGVDLIRTMKDRPRIVLTTAYKDHAMEAFDLHVTDYLLKPFSFERFQMAVDKARIASSTLNHNKEEFIDVRVERKMIKIPVQDIHYIQAVGNYIKIYLAEKTVITYNTILNIKKSLPVLKFRQVHRSYIVNIDRVSEYTAATISLGSIVLPVGRRFKNNFESSPKGGSNI
jgi:DNA-binding LytR/AlgR family response regulator